MFEPRLRAAAALLTTALLAAACDSSPSRTAPTTQAPEAPAASAPAPSPEPTPTPAPVAADTTLLLQPGRVGVLRLNMTEAAVRELIPAERLRRASRSLEGIDYPVLELTDPAAPVGAPPVVLELEQTDDEGTQFRVWRAQVRDPRYRTAEGIGVGSTFGQARLAYGVQTIELADAGLVAVSERPRMTWMLDARQLPPNTPLRKENIPPDMRITGVILFR